MVRKIIAKLATPVRGLHQAAYLLASLTLASQLLALLRDRIFASMFGAGDVLDRYYAAFKVPDLVFALMASLVSAYVLIPLIAGQGKRESRRILSETTSFLVVGSGLIALLLFFLMPSLLAALFPNLMEASAGSEEFVALSRLLLLQPILLGLSGILTSVTQVEKRFVLYALSPVLYNLGIIGGALFLYPEYGLAGIGFGVLGGALMHLAVHIPVVVGARLVPKPRLPRLESLWPIVRESAPRSLALAMGSVTTLMLTQLASSTGTGGIAVFTLASNLEAVPLALIGASYATAAFPVLAEQAGKNHMEAFRATITAASRHLIFWSSVLLVLMIVMRAHIVRILYGSGSFDWDDTRLTAAVLALLVTALVAQGFVLLASRAFYAVRKSWNPLFIQVGGAIASVSAAWLMLSFADSFPFFRYFIETLLRVEDIQGSKILFIAFGAAIGQLCMGAIALYTLKDVAPGVGSSLVRPLLEGLAAGILGGFAAYGTLSYMGNLAPLTTLASVFTQGVIAGMVGLIVSAAVLVLLENKEFRDLYDSLSRIKGLAKALPPHGPILNDR